MQITFFPLCLVLNLCLLMAIRFMSRMYVIVVKELETADPERTEEILVQTFDERRKWVTGDNGPKITEVLGAYPVFHTDNDQVKLTGYSDMVEYHRH